MSKQKMNLPNKLTVLRLLLVPAFVVVMMLPGSHIVPMARDIIGASIFILAALTDLLDGKIARKQHLVTDFGKLMDPLADKFMVIGALTVIVYRYDNLRWLFIWALLLVVFRELAVTSIRLVAAASKEQVVVPANILGKIKTVLQIVCVCATIIEPLLYQIPFLKFLSPYLPITYTTCILMMIFTLWSGVNYIVSMWKYLDPEK